MNASESVFQYLSRQNRVSQEIGKVLGYTPSNANFSDRYFITCESSKIPGKIARQLQSELFPETISVAINTPSAAESIKSVVDFEIKRKIAIKYNLDIEENAEGTFFKSTVLARKDADDFLKAIDEFNRVIYLSEVSKLSGELSEKLDKSLDTLIQ
jgi:hypothetical protein